MVARRWLLVAAVVLAAAAAASASSRSLEPAEDPEEDGLAAKLEDPRAVVARLHRKDSVLRQPMRFREELRAEGDDADSDGSGEDDAGATEAAPAETPAARAPVPARTASKGLRSMSQHAPRGSGALSEAQAASLARFQELRAKAQRNELTAAEAEELEMRRRGFFDSVGKFIKKGVSAVGNVISSITGSNSGDGSVNPKTGEPDKMLAQDIEDCVGCRFVWLAVELDVGNSQVEETIYDSFVKQCMEAEKAPIFFQTCQDMFDDVYGMIGDYMNGYTVNQVCEGARMCR